MDRDTFEQHSFDLEALEGKEVEKVAVVQLVVVEKVVGLMEGEGKVVATVVVAVMVVAALG